MKYQNIILLLIIAFLSVSCKDKKKETIVQFVEEWQGKEIVFPSNMIFTHYLTDTVEYQIPQSDYKVLIYVDSIGCTSCKLQLPKWKEFMTQVDSLTSNPVHSLAVKKLYIKQLQPKNKLPPRLLSLRQKSVCQKSI